VSIPDVIITSSKMRFRTNLAIGIASYVALGMCPRATSNYFFSGNQSLYTIGRVMRTLFCPVERLLAIGSAGGSRGKLKLS